jgi:hypothetical protein
LGGFFDRIIFLREKEGIDVKLMIQVDTMCHRIPNFVDKAARAGVTRVFIGMESVNPAALTAAKKRQNKISAPRRRVLPVEEEATSIVADLIE